MDNNKSIEWNDKHANDILKAAYELQNLCKKSRGCVVGCPFRTDIGTCIFVSKPTVPWKWNIQEETVYTVKLPDA